MHALTNQPEGYEARLAVAVALIDLHLSRRPFEVFRRREKNTMLDNVGRLLGKVEAVAHEQSVETLYLRG